MLYKIKRNVPFQITKHYISYHETFLLVMNKKLLLCWAMMLLLSYLTVDAKQIIRIIPQKGDMTLVVQKALEEAVDKDIVIKFTKGEYHFHSDYSKGKYCAITNHDNGYKNIIFLFENFNSLEIQGNDSEFIFHGRVFPFRIENCEKVKISDLSIDWDIPFLFQGELMAINHEEGWYDIKPFVEGFSWQYQNEQITFPNIDNFAYDQLGNTLAFDKKHKRVVHGAIDKNSATEKIVKRENGHFRFYDTFRCDLPLGSIINYKGNKGENRYAPAIQVMASSNILLDNVTIHHALGMGFLFEKSSDIILKNCGVYLKKGTERVVSSTADATHFCNCKGFILVENCRFENMLDDGTNVHGTYAEINSIINNKVAIIELKHFQQMGFDFADEGDEVWFIQQPNPERAFENTIEKVKTINQRFIKLSFKNNLPESLKTGDIIENKTWNPSFTMRGCTIRNHRARSVVLKTPKKIIIENNNISSMMASIFFRGETFYWFESGSVEDVLIRNNNFEYCAYSGNDQAILYITPRLGKTFDQKQFFDRNIRFEKNTINNFSNRIVIADRVDGLSISENMIFESSSPDRPLINPEAYLFTLTNCQNVKIIRNEYKGSNTKVLKADAQTEATLIMKENKGLSKTLGSN